MGIGIDFFVDTNVLIYAIIAATAKVFNLPLLQQTKDLRKSKT